jgi:hypothetical protein
MRDCDAKGLKSLIDSDSGFARGHVKALYLGDGNTYANETWTPSKPPPTDTRSVLATTAFHPFLSTIRSDHHKVSADDSTVLR